VALLLLVAGVFFGAMLALNNLFKTVGRVEKISFLELLLNYLTALTLLAALIVNNLGAFGDQPISGRLGELDFTIPMSPPDPFVEYLTLLACGALAAYSLLIILLELFRPWRLKASRGVFGLFSAGMIALAVLFVPFLGAYFALEAAPTPVPDLAANVPTSTATPPSDTTLPDDTAATDPETTARISALFQAIRTILRDEIDLPEGEVFAQLDRGVPLAEIVRASGGDVETVIRQLTEVMRGLIADSAERGEIPRLQAALFSSQMGTFIRIAVNNDLTTLGQRFGGPTPDPSATRGSLTDLLTALPPIDATPTAPAPAASTATAVPTDPPTALATDTPAPTLTPTPSPTRTPLPTSTPTPNLIATLFADLTLTPFVTSPTIDQPTGAPDSDGTPVPASATPRPVTAFCLGSVNNNLRLRSAPSRDAETILVIPFTTVLELTARNSDSTWYATTYEGQSGWVDGEFLSVGASCAALPFR
jgi:hypothetical protein